MLIKAGQSLVILDARTCAWLERYAGLTALRVKVAGTDRVITEQLTEIRVAAMSWRSSATGTAVDAQPELPPKSEWMSTGEAGQALDVSDSAIRKAIRNEKLNATQVAGRYRISKEDLEHYRAARRSQQ